MGVPLRGHPAPDGVERPGYPRQQEEKVAPEHAGVQRETAGPLDYQQHARRCDPDGQHLRARDPLAAQPGGEEQNARRRDGGENRPVSRRGQPCPNELRPQGDPVSHQPQPGQASPIRPPRPRRSAESHPDQQCRRADGQAQGEERHGGNIVQHHLADHVHPAPNGRRQEQAECPGHRAARSAHSRCPQACAG